MTDVPDSTYDGDEVLNSFNRSVRLNQQWILRAGDVPVVLSLYLRRQHDRLLEGTISTIKVKKLHLDLFRDQFTIHRAVRIARYCIAQPRGA